MSLETRVGSDPYQSYVPRLLFEWQRDYNDETFREITGTMVFADISGFTALSEMLSQFGKLGAEEVTDVIGDCFQALLDVVYPLGGRLLKFGGDALLLLFTGPDHARRAVNAAVGMMKEMGRVGKVKTSGGRITLRMSIGIHSGSFDFYLVGDSHRELIITGSAATTTAEMETAATAGEIAVSPATASQLPPDIVGPLKGDAYLVVGSTSDDFDTDVDVRPARSDLEEFVPVAIRELILADAIEAEHRLVTIAFIQFLEVEKMRHEQGMAGVAAALHELVTDVQSAIDPRHITFVSTDIYDDGGKIILAAGAPTSTGNDEERMLDALRQIASKRRQLPIRIGLNRGHVFAGDVGPDYRHSYTVMGDGVNLAARLMSAADIGEIRSTPAVLDHSRTMYATTALEPFMVKGKAEPVHACSVGEEIGTRIDIDEHRLPFMGRDHELQVLRDALALAEAGTGSTVTISGDRGIGKTRLVDEAIRGFQPIIEVHAEPYGAANPYRALRDPIRELLGIERSDHGSMAKTLAAAIKRVDSSLLPLMPLVADIVQIEVPSTPEVDDIEPRFRPERAADILVTIIEDLIPGPLAIVVDDGHYADEASGKLLTRLCSETATRPWIVLTTRRNVEGGFEPPGAPMILDPLDPATARSIIIDVTEDAPLRPHELEAIVERTGGNPLYIGEVLVAVKTAGSFSDLPDSLDALVTTQIDALPPGSRQLLRYASVLGRSFRPELLRRILNGNADDVNRLIHKDLSAFLELADGRVRFRHSIHRDAAYEGLSFRKRRELHLAAGQAIQELAPDPDAVADALGMHFYLGHDFEMAWKYSRIAGDDARDAYGNVEAATNYERALEAGKRLKNLDKAEVAKVWIALGDAREQIAKFPDAIDAFRRAGKLLSNDPVAQADVIAKRALAKMRDMAYTSALADATRGLKLLEPVGTMDAGRARARLMTTRARILMNQRRLRQALGAAREAIGMAKAANEEESLLGAYDVHDGAQLDMGQPEKAIYSEKALAIAERIGLLPAASMITNNLGAKAYFAGEWDRALDMYGKSMDSFERAGNTTMAAMAGSNIGELMVSQRKFDEAEPILLDSIRVLRASDAKDPALFAETQLGRLYAERGDHEKAVPILEVARSQLLEEGQAVNSLEAAIYLAAAHLKAGDPNRALDLLEDAEAAAGSEVVVMAAMLGRVRGAALAVLGHKEAALAELNEALELASQQGLIYERALSLKACVDLSPDARSEEARSMQADAEALFERLGVEPATYSGTST